MIEASLIAFGIAISSITMAIGIGGGILWTPLLIFAYHLSPAEAITSSLIIQIAGLGSGAFAYNYSNRVNRRLAAILFLFALPGVIIGSFFTINLSKDTVQMALGTMAMVLAILFVASSHDTNENNTRDIPFSQALKVAPIPGFFGFVMGFLSLGISEWLIPALRTRFKMEMQQAIGTSVTMMFMLAVVASLLHISLSETLHTDIILYAAIGTLIGGQIGAKISQKINDRLLKQSFIYLMTLIGIHLIFQSI